MAKVLDHITDELQKFIAAQQIFFVATAPLSATGHINLSPKGLDSFRILSPHQVAYLDLTGSGNETSAHLQENGRITFMFCALQGKPLILRLFGQGRTILPNSPDWNTVSPLFSSLPGTRQIFVAEIDRVQTSCGTGVPLFEYQQQREELVQWAAQKGEAGIQTYQQQKNRVSIDGLATPLASES
ncbi:MAG: pyridoxamine 5'-phosphate oxidase family protein [Oscillatoriophycideae cyanobacterium NC_groundwater_1537_Pr4_S-0.65um_50_18]|nr:pyridoxamine 5'-phosphate oxidase family protein [Oscillatoriophycideae cyanobacterium NC_groundwater_1537_Pr4_S-0.65um_50_18]